MAVLDFDPMNLNFLLRPVYPRCVHPLVAMLSSVLAGTIAQRGARKSRTALQVTLLTQVLLQYCTPSMVSHGSRDALLIT